MARDLTTLARNALREAYAVQTTDEAAKAHARRALNARGADEQAASQAVETAFMRWFHIAGAN